MQLKMHCKSKVKRRADQTKSFEVVAMLRNTTVLVTFNGELRNVPHKYRLKWQKFFKFYDFS